MLLVEVALARVAAEVAGADAEDELEVGAGRREGDLRVALAAAVLEAHLALLDRPVPEARVFHLQIYIKKAWLFRENTRVAVYKLCA